MAFLVLHLVLERTFALDYFCEKLIQIGTIEIVADASQGSADVTGEQIKCFGGQRREATNGKVSSDQHDTGVDAEMKIL